MISRKSLVPFRFLVAMYSHPCRPTSPGFCPLVPTPAPSLIHPPTHITHTHIHQGVVFCQEPHVNSTISLAATAANPDIPELVFIEENASVRETSTRERHSGGGGRGPEEAWVSDGRGRLGLISPSHFPPPKCSKPPARMESHRGPVRSLQLPVLSVQGTG